MIRFTDVHKSYGFGRKRVTPIDSVSFAIQPRTTVAILGRPKSGRTTLMRLLSNLTKPDSGEIERHMTTSWPAGLPMPIPAATRIFEYVHTIAALYGADGDQLFDAMAQIADIAHIREKKAPDLDGDARGRIAFAITMALDFDCVVFDGAATFGGRAFRKKCEAYLTALRGRRAFAIATDNPDVATKHCDVAYILRNGRLTAFETVNDAARTFKRT